MNINKVIITFVILLSLFFQSCEEEKPEEFIKKKEEKEVFKPFKKLGEPVFFENLNLVLLPKTQNYIKRNNKTFRIAVTTGEKFGKSYEDRDVVNYEWRLMSDYRKKFRKMFAQDLPILRMYSHADSDYDSNKVPIPYLFFLVIEADSNKNEIFDQVNDIKSLFIFDITRKKIRKISPDKVNVIDDYLKIYSSSKFIKYQFRPHLHGMHLFIYFKAFDPESKIIKQYLYHIKSKKLEILDNHLLEKYKPIMYKRHDEY